MTQIYLIRHGEAEGNIYRRIHGQYNSMLTPAGRAQADCVRSRFADISIDACYSSDLTRTSLTARSIYIPKGLSLRRDPAFREVNLGVWEDIPFGYLHRYEEAGIHTFNDNPPCWHGIGAEDFDTYTQRFIEGMKHAAEENDGGTIAIFCHGAVMRGTLMRLFYWGHIQDLPYSDNTGVSLLHYEKGEFSAVFVNDNSHLPQQLSTYYRQSWRRTGQKRNINLYYEPLSEKHILPSGLVLPEQDSRGVTMVGILEDRPVGVVSMGAPAGDTGVILGISLDEKLWHQDFSEQFLGCAISHFRRLGCKNLEAVPGVYPDDVLHTYDFDETLHRSIDAEAFEWGNTNAQK